MRNDKKGAGRSFPAPFRKFDKYFFLWSYFTGQPYTLACQIFLASS